MKTVDRMWRWLVNRKRWQLVLLLFAIALTVRVAFVLVFHTYRDLTRVELERTAISLATTGVFGNPYAIPTGPSAHVSPGYTLILAGVFRVFGTGIPAEVVKQVLAAATVALLCALIPAAASAMGLDRRAGIVAGLVAAIYPARPLVEIEGDWETPYTALALMLVAHITVRLWKHPELTAKRAALHGLAWGVSLLFVSAMMTLFAILLVAGFWYLRRGGSRRYAQFVAIEVAVVALCLAPWAIRNKQALGSVVTTRTNLGLELRISNNDYATPDQRVNYLAGLFSKYHPLLNVAEAEKVRDMGEIAYNRQAKDEAIQWIRTHRRQFTELSLGRARCFWLYYDPTSRAKTLFLGITVLLGLGGLVYTARRDRITGVVLALMLLIYPLPHYLIHVGLRQEFPIHWLMTLLSAVLAVAAVDGVVRRRALGTLAPPSLRGTPVRY